MEMELPQLNILQWSRPSIPNNPRANGIVSASNRRRRKLGGHRNSKGINGIQSPNLGRKHGIVHCSQNNGEIGSAEWLAKASPLEVLGVQDDYTEHEIRAAFRAKVKEYHPDVYKGPGNASVIIQRIIQAYEILIKCISQGEYIPRARMWWLVWSREDVGAQATRRSNTQSCAGGCRKPSDPFEVPECEALDIFVNELLCIGKGCPYSCVTRAPHVFSYNPKTRCAHAITQGQGEDYQVQLAVGQCPRNCIHYVTPAQRNVLEELLKRSLEGSDYLSESTMLESLITRANFENNRYQGRPKRNAKHSTQCVDWF